MKVQNPTIGYLQKMHFKYKDIKSLKVKAWENILPCKTMKPKKDGAAILIL